MIFSDIGCEQIYSLSCAKLRLNSADIGISIPEFGFPGKDIKLLPNAIQVDEYLT